MNHRTGRRGLLRQGMAAGLLASGLPALTSGTVRAQAWPSKPVRIVVSFPAGGLTDAFARAYGDYISQKVGQPVVVENKAGAGGIIGAELVGKSPADGHTLLFTISTTMVMNRVLYKSLPYDPDKDFIPISFMSAGHLPFVVHKSVPATNLKEFAAWAKTNKVSIGTYAAGSYSHVVVAELNRIFGLSMEAVHYRGEAPMWQDLASGAIHGGSGSYQAMAGVLVSGAGRAIAVPQTIRMKKLPDVPTFLEQGIDAKAFQIRGWIGLFAPTGTPPDIVDRLSALMVEGGQTPRIRQMLDTFGVDDAATDRKTFEAILKEESPIWIELVKGLGITPQ
ncbi:MAG TPA: tripartite tricarboxylate transporter substrate binding protein [Vineibacter sp.]|nr:tripartite tricarboxylate transporter substrate binding protein [Vineibacter sp.]